MKKTKNFGTQEWAPNTVNCCTGCSHDCLYCYAKSMAIRFKQLNAGDWPLERIRMHDVNKKHKKYPGKVMFPSSHDITPANLTACTAVLNNLLEAGNDVLIVSKPHLDCVSAICNVFKDYRKQILFRFSIGACNNAVLSFWEPNAPDYEERKAALKHAFDSDFQTSVSVEPMLDSANIDALMVDLLPYVTDAIWIGKMNHVGRISNHANGRIRSALQQIKAGQTDSIIKSIYERHKANPQIKWKKEIKKVVGIPLAPMSGMDI
jgi:DNA repair photolyase